MNEWESRKELLQFQWKNFIELCDQLPPNDADYFTSPMSDILLRAISQLQNDQLQKDGGKIIQMAFDKK